MHCLTQNFLFNVKFFYFSGVRWSWNLPPHNASAESLFVNTTLSSIKLLFIFTGKVPSLKIQHNILFMERLSLKSSIDRIQYLLAIPIPCIEATFFTPAGCLLRKNPKYQLLPKIGNLVNLSVLKRSKEYPDKIIAHYCISYMFFSKFLLSGFTPTTLVLFMVVLTMVETQKQCLVNMRSIKRS